MLGEEILLELANGPFHASIFVILFILLLNGHISEVHVQVLHVCLVCGVPGRRKATKATPAQAAARWYHKGSA